MTHSEFAKFAIQIGWGRKFEVKCFDRWYKPPALPDTNYTLLAARLIECEVTIRLKPIFTESEQQEGWEEWFNVDTNYGPKFFVCWVQRRSGVRENVRVGAENWLQTGQPRDIVGYNKIRAVEFSLAELK